MPILHHVVHDVDGFIIETEEEYRARIEREEEEADFFTIARLHEFDFYIGDSDGDH